MINGTIDIVGLMLYRENAQENGKSEEYLLALSDLLNALQDNKAEYDNRKKANLEKLNKRKENSKDSELITLYFYERRADGSIIKNTYKAVEKKNSYEVKDCWRSRLSKNHDINKYTDTLHHAMWTDAENDELMEELLERYQLNK